MSRPCLALFLAAVGWVPLFWVMGIAEAIDRAANASDFIVKLPIL